MMRPPLRYADMAVLLRAWRAVARVVERSGADFLIAHPCQFLQAPAVLRFAAVPSVYFCHETRRVDYEDGVASARNPATARLYGPLYHWQRRSDRSAARAPVALVTNSRYTAGQIEAAYGRSAAVVPLGVPEHLRPAEPARPPQHVLSVGNLVANKGHELVIRAAARSRRRWPVVIVSPRPSAPEERRLRAVADGLGTPLAVRIGISDQELCHLYREAVATLYLAAMEPLGLASLEAQACGCPVIVSDEGGLPETVLPGETGWAIPRDAVVAADLLDQLDDRDLRETVCRQAAAHGARYTWERSTREFERAAQAAAAADQPASRCQP
jgi:glycosyltransferase involved in cell wall biosynthesis